MSTENKTIPIEFYVMVNAEGEFIVHMDLDELQEEWANESAGYNVSVPNRLVKVRLDIKPPSVQTVAGTIPDDSEQPIALSFGPATASA